MDISCLKTGPLSVNTWFIPLDAQRMMIIDPGGDADSIIAHVAERSFNAAIILITHGHFDHITALPALVEAWPGIEIAIHTADSHLLGKGAIDHHYEHFVLLGIGQMVRRLGIELPEPTRLLSDGDDVEGWKVIHTPGHSPGSICLYNEAEKTLVSGDTLFCRGIGRTDGPGGSDAEMEESLARIFTLPGDTTVLPGHGWQTTIGRER